MPSIRRLALLGSAVLCAAASTTLAVPNYTITPLPSPGAQDIYVHSINNAGQIVGYTVDDNGSHAALWDSNGIHYLDGVNSAYTNSKAYKINNNGEIVGLSQFDSNYNHATYWSPSRTPTDIGTLSGLGGSFANDINDHGVVVGSSSATRGQHAFTWTASEGISDWGSFAPNSNAEIAGFNAINNNGLMGGTHYYYSDPFRAMIADYNDSRRTLTNISPMVGRYSQGMVHAINDAGTIVGYQNSYVGDGHAAIFLPEDGSFIDLGALGLDASRAYDINELGVIVGEAYSYDYAAAFVYDDKTMYDLLDLIVNAQGWDLLFAAHGINDNGYIVGEGVFNGEIRGFVLAPTAIPEPATLSLLALPTLSLLRRRR